MTTSTRKRTPHPGERITSVSLPLPVWTAVKIRAANERRSLRAVLLSAVERYLETPLEPSAAPAKGDA